MFWFWIARIFIAYTYYKACKTMLLQDSLLKKKDKEEEVVPLIRDTSTTFEREEWITFALFVFSLDVLFVPILYMEWLMLEFLGAFFLFVCLCYHKTVCQQIKLNLPTLQIICIQITQEITEKFRYFANQSKKRE